MNPLNYAQISELFHRLVDLPAYEQAQQIAALQLDPASEKKLRGMLHADSTDDALNLAIASAAQAMDADQNIPSGSTLGAYRLIRELGAGGMGTVFLAERSDDQYQQQVAIKLIRGFPTEDHRRRLRQERQILAELDHPNIARLIDGGETASGQPYIVMEYVAGVTLTEYLQKHELSVDQRLQLFDKILQAVAHAHQRLVIHRDIKPSNVLVREDGEPKLLDFGVAKLVELGVDDRHTSTRVMTPGYASPEQRDGKAITTASDVYSLGKLMRDLLAENRVQAIHAELNGILLMACAEQVSERYPTVEALREDLRRYRQHLPVRAAAATRWYFLRKFLWRHRFAVALSATALLAVAIFVQQLYQQTQRALRAEARAEQALVKSRDDASLARDSMDFLSETIIAVAPENTLGKPITARDLLDQANLQLNRKTATSKELKQNIQRLLGAMYHGLGEGQLASDLFAQGLQDVTVSEREQALRLADDWAIYSAALVRVEKFDEAMNAVRESAALRKQYAADDSTQQIKVLLDEALVLRHKANWQLAAPLLEQAVALLDSLEAGAQISLVDALLPLVEMYLADDRIDDAQKVVDRLSRFFLENHLSQHPDYILCLTLGADVLIAKGEFAAAEPIIQQAIALHLELIGDSGQLISTLQNNYGQVLNELGRYKEAVARMQRSTEIDQQIRVGGNKNNSVSLSNIASVYESAGDYQAALPLFEQAVELGCAEIENRLRECLVARGNAARGIFLSGQRERGRQLAAALQNDIEAAMGRENFEWGKNAFRQANMARQAGDMLKAKYWGEQAKPVFASIVPAEHYVFGHFERLEGLIALAEHRYSDALPLLQSAHKRFESAFGNAHPDTNIVLADLASLYFEQGKKEKARALLLPAIVELRKTLLPSEVNLAAAEALAKKIQQ